MAHSRPTRHLYYDLIWQPIILSFVTIKAFLHDCPAFIQFSNNQIFVCLFCNLGTWPEWSLVARKKEERQLCPVIFEKKKRHGGYQRWKIMEQYIADFNPVSVVCRLRRREKLSIVFKPELAYIVF